MPVGRNDAAKPSRTKPARDTGTALSPGRSLLSAAAAAAVALFAHMCASFGLFAVQPTWLMAPVTCVAIGVVTALVSGASGRRAFLGGLAGVTLGAIIAPTFVSGTASAGGATGLASAIVLGLVAGAVAGVTGFALGRAADRRVWERIFSAGFVLLVVLGLWSSVGTFNSGVFNPQGPSLNELLKVRPTLGNTEEDHNVFLHLYYDVRDGESYYDSYVRIFLADSSRNNTLPPGIAGYRLPTIFYLWQLVPDASALPRAFLIFATVGVVSAFFIAVQLVRPGVAVLAPLIVAPAFLYLGATTYVAFVDGWAITIALGGMALFVTSVRRESRALLWGAVMVFLAAALLREIMLYPMLLAAASTALGVKGTRWRDAVPWIVGIGLFALAYAAHIVAIDGRVAAEKGVGFWLHGGLGHLVATVRFFEFPFGAKPWFLPLITLLGIVGGAVVWRSDRRLGAFLTATVVLPLAAFLVVGNGGKVLSTGEALGYWGVLVLPFAFSLVPVAVERGMVALNARGRGMLDA